MSHSAALSRLTGGDGRSDMIKWALRRPPNVVVGGTPVMFDHGQVSAPADVAVLTA